MVNRHVYTISLDKASTGRLTSSSLRKPHMSVGARRRAYSAMVATWLHGVGCRVNCCPCVLDSHLEVGDGLGNGMHLYCLTGQRPIK
jgi:hypothetical protein